MLLGMVPAIPVIRHFLSLGMDAILQRIPSENGELCELLRLVFSLITDPNMSVTLLRQAAEARSRIHANGECDCASASISGGASASGAASASGGACGGARANRTPEEAALVAAIGESCCDKCGKPTKQGCSGCRAAIYCSKECQKADWKQHKQTCAGRKKQ